MTFVAQPSRLRGWETLTKLVLVLDGVLAAVDVLVAVAMAVRGSLFGAERVALMALSALWFFVWSGWTIQTGRLLRSFGDDARRLGRHWSNALSFVLVVAAWAGFVQNHRSPAFPGLLAVSVASAMLSVVKTRALVRGVASGEIAPQARNYEPQPPAASGPTVRYDTPPDTTGLAPADDDFWAAATRASRDAALLETLPTMARRWLEIPADGDVTAIRASIPAGATLTLWPAPVAATGEPLTAPEYYGLLQASADGPTRFQLVLPSRVPAFVAESRAAHRAALYLPADPAARTVLQPE